MTGAWFAEVFCRYLVWKAVIYALVAPVAAGFAGSWSAPAILISCALCAYATALAVRRFA